VLVPILGVVQTTLIVAGLAISTLVLLVATGTPSE